MQCNIDAKGKAVRLVSGIVTVVAALVLGGLGLASVVEGMWVWIVAAAALAGGAFQIFEGWCSWCVLRAMGFRTPV